ncbi:DNA glycosylase/AP lyase ROS1 [Sesamum angolense]|uniref:DNA glycosylase/AP lyase ROS1 n=1 Tax=Sesamum angolense TaxID=2727404 RepID=A0AAE1XCP4_9LAMI|nr:DNA glycosylase/AP lyase ROS1 [Sesamum angolense]
MRDLSSFVNDLSKIQVSEVFLLRASSVRTQGSAKFAASMAAQDEGPQNSVIEQHILPQDNSVSCNESIQKSPTEFGNCVLGVEIDIPNRSLEIDVLNYQVVEGHRVVAKSMEMVSCSDKLLPYHKSRCKTRTFDIPPCFQPREDINFIRKKYLLESDIVTPYLMGPHHEQTNAFSMRDCDRRFSPWKGSVVDSVVGVFLTQNVSDHLSSSAFMSLAARFPPPTVTEQNGLDDRSDCVIDERKEVKIAETPSGKCEELSMMENYPSSSCPPNEVGVDLEKGNEASLQTESTSRKKGKVKDKQENTINWDDLRKNISHGSSRNRTYQTMDSVNWEAVRQAKVEELAKVIMERGMNNILAGRIKDFLDRIVRDHGSIDLEWLRDVPPDKAKEYLLSIPGLGLKSVECVRLLTLRHHAFPVDTNVGRILVRLGWVPLQPLPEDVQIHLLNQYECHYQMITFGKVFCTKRRPNCNACPMRGECRHFASAFARYEIPDSHPLLAGFEKREPDDPCPYLLAIWTTDESTSSSQEPRKACNCQKSTCDMSTCSGQTVQNENDWTVQGTILIPCRTANRGAFPLNGTYFQVNEVFADHESSRHPIAVPREWIWNLRRRALFCGTSVTSISRGFSLEQIEYCFRKGFICVRGINRKTGAARPLARRFHLCKTRQVDDE